jgi:hypothetical protein
MGAAVLFYFDVVFFHAQQITTSKYTVSNVVSANRTITKPRCYSTFNVFTNWGTITESDATLATLSGTRNYVWADLGVTTEQETATIIYIPLAKQAYNIGGEPINLAVVNPSDMYNLMLGDTITLTATNMNLSAATRILGRREDSLTEAGWRTVLSLVAIPPTNPISELWEIVKKKRF